MTEQKKSKKDSKAIEAKSGTVQFVEPLNVWQRVSAVRGEIQAVQKDKTVGTGAYAYDVATHDAIKAELRPIMAKYGLVDYIIEKSYKRIETGVMRGGDAGKRPLMSHQGIYLYRCVNVDQPEDMIEFQVRGDGEDTGDKGTGKSNTYALKAGQKILFQIGTDAGEEDRIPEEELTQVGEECISDEQIDVLMKLSDELFDTESNAMLALMADKFFGIKNITELSVKNFDFAIKNLKQKARGEKIKAAKEAAEAAKDPQPELSLNDSEDIPPLGSETDPNEPESL